MKYTALVLAATLALGTLIGCGGDDGGTEVKDTTPPEVILTDPADGATGISPNRPVLISFSESMDEASLDSIFVEGATLASIDYDDDSHSASLSFGDVLADETEYEVRVGAAVQDKAGNEMESDLTFSYTTGSFSCAGLYDPFEPNDDISSAKPVDLDTWYHLIPSCGGDERKDYYKYTLTDPAMTTLKVHFAYGDTTHMRWGINFNRADGGDYATLGIGYLAYPGDVSFHYSFLPGTYYTRIYKSDDDQYTGVYDFIIETSEACADDEYEDNDFPDEATPIAAGLFEGLRACYVDNDYYTIEMTPGETLKVTMTEVTSVGGYRMLNLSGPGVNVGLADRVEPRVEMVSITQAGTYLIRIRWWEDGIIYDLNVEVLD